MENFADGLLRQIDKAETPLICGLDPDLGFMPQYIQDKALDKYPRLAEDDFRAEGFALFEFNKQIIDALHGNRKNVVPAVKPQIAFYEAYKAPGIEAFDRTIKYARKKGFIVIEDGKRNDIGNTAKKYADGHLGKVKLLARKGEERKCAFSYDLDALTVNGYLGSDCILEFVKPCKIYGKGIFVLDKTSNPSAGEIQDLVLESGIMLSEEMAHWINRWAEGAKGAEGYKSVGAVVGATYAGDARKLRRIMQDNIFLVPGLGKSQGGEIGDTHNFLNPDGRGAVFNMSRDLIDAVHRKPEYLEKYGEENFHEAARDEAIIMKENLTEVVRKVGKSRW